MEFALIAPLIAVCAGLLLSTTYMCLQYIGLHDIARHAARVAVVSANPEKEARDSVQDSNIEVHVTEDLQRGTITVTVSRTSGIWWLQRLVTRRGLSDSVTMMRESPIVLG